jgi:hypothetical protein
MTEGNLGLAYLGNIYAGEYSKDWRFLYEMG